jgi:serine/threonine protein kinase
MMIASAEREISCLRALKHPLIIEMVDIVKDKEDRRCLIMEKCNKSLNKIIESYQE